MSCMCSLSHTPAHCVTWLFGWDNRDHGEAVEKKLSIESRFLLFFYSSSLFFFSSFVVILPHLLCFLLFSSYFSSYFSSSCALTSILFATFTSEPYRSSSLHSTPLHLHTNFYSIKHISSTDSSKKTGQQWAYSEKSTHP